MSSTLLILAVIGATSSTTVAQLEIQASWSGLMFESQYNWRPRHLLVTCVSEQCSADNHAIPVALVEAFRAAAMAPPLDHLDLENLGITPAWREDVSYTYLLGDCAVRGDVARELVRREFEATYEWTDDYPAVSIRMTLSSGAVVSVFSSSQKLFMLPWDVERPGSRWSTYDATISRALAALLPNTFLNRQRVLGENMAYWYAYAFVHGVEKACCGASSKP